MLVIDPGQPVGPDASGEGIGHAPATFLTSEDTLYVFSPDDVESAVRNTYQANTSGVVFVVTFVRPELLKAAAFGDVAGSWAWVWDQNAAVPGVTDIAVTQRTKPLGGLEDVAEVAITSTSGRSTGTLTLTQADVMPDTFAEKVRAAVARLDAIEGVTA